MTKQFVVHGTYNGDNITCFCLPVSLRPLCLVADMRPHNLQRARRNMSMALPSLDKYIGLWFNPHSDPFGRRYKGGKQWHTCLLGT